jgi:hypothetical protein
MNNAAAFQATVHGLRTVPSRKVVQLVLEFPIEELSRVAGIAEHGAWVGVARLQLPEGSPELSRDEREPEKLLPAGERPPQSKPKRERQPWAQLAPSQQAAIRCGDPLFRAFLEWKYKRLMRGEDDAAVFVRGYCRVKSRKEIIEGDKAADYWKVLEGCFDDWKIADKAGVI